MVGYCGNRYWDKSVFCGKFFVDLSILNSEIEFTTLISLDNATVCYCDPLGLEILNHQIEVHIPGFPSALLPKQVLAMCREKQTQSSPPADGKPGI